MVRRALSLGRNRFNVRMSSVSQTLSFNAYDVYGFDIDHTLAKYNLPNLFTVRCRCTCYLQCGQSQWSKRGMWVWHMYTDI